jgi:hypothetical protein
VLTTLLIIVLAGLAFFAAIAAVSLVCVWLMVRKVRRSRPWNRGKLLIRSASAPSRPAREVTRLRIQLFDTVAATGRMLAAAPAPDVLSLLAREIGHSASLADHRLQLLAAEPDSVLLGRVLPSVRFQVEELCVASGKVRETAWHFTTDLDQLHTEALTQEVADQVAGLQRALAEVRALDPHVGWTTSRI